MKKILFTIFSFLMCFTMGAYEISETDAMATAKVFLASKGSNLKSKNTPYRAPRRNRDGNLSDKSYYYVFEAENDEGFVIISGDDRTEKVLGYVDNGTFDSQNIPDNMRSWLQLYSDQIKYLDDNNIEIDGDVARARAKARRISQTRHNIPIMLTTKWNQGDPYNSSCPDYYKEDGTKAKPASGCVATALAQVMYYYKYPATTQAMIPQHSNTYKVLNSAGGISERTVTARPIPRGTTIDWDNMCETYENGGTEAQRKAVGDLMLYIGQSVGMGWGASSGAGFGSNVAYAFTKYFGYDDRCYAASRGDYSIDEWFNLLYNELATGHPIGFAGGSTGGAHAFVIDGFDGEQLFHVNWGWGGFCDGWFLINILNPGDNTGIGASSSSDGYSMGQTAIIGVDYPDDIKVESKECLTINNIEVIGTSVKGSYINWTGKKNSFLTTMLIYNEEDGTFTPISGTTQNVSDIGVNHVRTLTTNLNNKLSPGTYKITPASRLTTNREWQPRFNCKREYLLVEVNESNVTTVKHVTPFESISVTNVEYAGSLLVGDEQEVKVTFQNHGDEYFREIHIFASKTNDKVYCDNRAPVEIRKDESNVVSFFFTPTEVGTYNIWLCTNNDGSGEIYHTTVEIFDPSDVISPSVRLNSIQVLNASNKIAYGNRMVGKLNLRNQRTSEYKGKIKIHLWVEDENSSSTYWSSSSIIKDVIIPGSRTLNVDFNFENLNYNRHYYFTVRYVATDSYIDNGQLWNNDLKFFVSPGINYWRTTGTLSGLACGTAFNVPPAACGVLFGDVTPKTIKKNTNPNTIYAFQGDNITLPTGSDAINNIVTNGVADSIQFVDDYAFYSPVTFTASHATYSYTFPVGEDSVHWHGITLPFTAKIANIDGVDYELDSEYNHFFVYEFSAIDNDNTPMFTPVTEMRGNAPYIVACDSLLFGKTIIFKGDNVTINQNGTTKIVTSSNAYNQYGQTLSTSLKNVYVLNEAGTAYELVTSASVNALDTYFTTSLPENACLQSIILPEIPRDIPIVDGIQNIENNKYTNSKDIYNLAGQRVGTLRNNQIKANNLRPGIYVVDGKKILLR